ncbi:cyclase/dehydrase [Magnetococcus marinus MC-1]|uniref:Cyclase/dehydrase n=1 Tax=Magnetococcus marinus (strain ATCC BAA-1437 / JCM 17883 / MC-1) TaxID=156889 RepID=A0L4S7_MAGMM|nr:type II toxin-antitoxin system RatA family toxin [Magnetococcus marinus]ABK42970.1 cyclase/dehydrase [Magnetococcus marinus MC-1]
MPKIKIEEIVPFSPQQMYDLVVDVDRYPEFLNWCCHAHIVKQEGNQFEAELTIMFKGIREKFRTLDKVVPGERVEISLVSGPFKHLTSLWVFEPVEPQGARCRIHFSIDFKFRNPVLNMTLGPVFSMISKQMVSDYRKRAAKLYR